MIIRESSAKLFNFERLILLEPIESIQPDAQFLFANLRRLDLIFSKYDASILEIAHTIDQFEQINTINDHKIAIDLQMSRMEEKSKNLELLAEYRVEKLHLFNQELSLNTLHCMNSSLNFVTQLNLTKCKFDKLDETAFEFCAQTLVKLNLSRSSITISEKGLLKPLVNLKCLVGIQIQYREFGDSDPDSEFVAGLEN